jgi:DNA mismatch repair protein MutS2
MKEKIMEKSLITLELHIIIEKIKAYVRLDSNRKMLDDIVLMDDPEEISRALDEVDEATVLIQRLSRFPLYFQSDISFTLKMLQKGRVIAVEELLEMMKFLDTVKACEVYQRSLASNEIIAPCFQEQVGSLIYPLDLNQRIKEIITPYGEIKDDASINLRQIRKSIKDTEKQLQAKLLEILNKNSSKLTSNLISIRNDRYVIPVRADLKNTVPGIIHDQSASGETVFIEPQAVNELNNRLNSLREDEKREIYQILREVSEEIAAEAGGLQQNYSILCHLDLVFAKGEYALAIDARKPRINTEGYLELINCRHPLLQVEKVVPNNLSIGKSYQGIIITGPNTGGKTVLLKTVGLLSLMVKCGLLIPCDESSQVMIFDQVFADIGDEQSIDQNLSTFSSHLKNVIAIINSVTKNSLVLLDELGSGTDPAEGSALAIAIFDYLMAKNCLVIATSHYSELKIHAYQSEKIINASVEFDVQTLKPTYKLLLGIPGQSNALKISKVLGLPEAIIARAEEYAYQKNDDINQVLEKLVSQSHHLDVLQAETEAKNRSLNEKIQALNQEKKELRQEKNRILENAEREAQKMIKDATQKMEVIFEELKDMKSRIFKPHEIADLKHQISELKASARREEEILAEDYRYEQKQSVFVESFGAYGIILKENKNNKYDVQIGNATVTVDRKYLRPADNPEQPVLTIKKTPLGVKKNVSMVLDLRGHRYEEALIKLEKFIDDAIYGSLKQISIIHGFGTGVIREMVLNYLKASSFVESYRYGGANEGGQGVTIVTLKN